MAKKDDDKDKLPIDKVANICVFLCGIEVFYTHLEALAAEQGELEGEALEVHTEHIKDGALLYKKSQRLLRRFKKEVAKAIETLAVVETKPGAGRLKAPLLKARTRPITTGAKVKAEFIKEAMRFISTRQNIRTEIFGTGKINTICRRVGTLPKEPHEAFLEMVSFPPLGGIRVTRSWMKEVAAWMKVGGTSEEKMADIGEAQQIGEEIKEIDRKLKVLPPSSDEAIELQAARSTKMDTLMKVAKGTGNEQAALGAASSIIYGNSNYATEVGKQLGLTEEQEAAMMVTGKSLIAAGAGSGKTRVLAGKVVDIINREGGKSNQIIATSFSKKSAAELKERVLKYGGGTILDGGDSGFGTTHSIGFSLLKKIKPKFKRAQILEGAYLIKMAMKQVEMKPNFGNAPSAPDPVGMFEGLFDTDSKSISINPGEEDIDGTGATSESDLKVRQIVDVIWGLVSWGLGKGYGWARGDAKVIEPMAQRIDSLKLEDLSSAEVSALKKMMGMGRYERSFERTRKKDLLNFKFANRRNQGNFWKEPADQWFNIKGDFKDDLGRAIGPKRVGLAIGNYRANLITPSQAWAQDRSVFAAAYGAYMWLKENEPKSVGKVDFTDMQLECIKALIENPNALRAVQSQYKWVLVDEAQDLNKLQHLLFGLIAGSIDPETQQEKTDGSMTAKTFTFIGDDKQAIYEFRGATPDEYSDKSHMRGGSFDTKLISSNFRSGKNIVDAANRLIAHNTKQIPMVCSTAPSRGEGNIEMLKVADHANGAAMCAQEIEDLIEAEGWSTDPPSFGVAVRTNAEALAYGVELIKKKIPFRSKMNFFSDPTTKALTGWLRLAGADGNKQVINQAVLTSFSAPRFYLDTTFTKALQKKARGKNYLNWLADGGWDEIYEGRSQWRNKNVKKYVDTLLMVRDFEGSPSEILDQIMGIKGVSFKNKPAQSILDALVEKTKGSPEAMDMLYEESTNNKVSDQDIKNLALAPIGPLLSLLEDFGDLQPALEYIQELQEVSKKKSYKDDPDDEEKDKPAVTIDTCHGWKGLEAKHMWVPMAGGVFPHANASGEEELASERRLAYVALTRGRDNVTVICPAVNHIGKPGGISRFVDEACIPSRMGDEESEESTKKLASDNLIQEWMKTADDDADLTESEWAEYDLYRSYGSLVSVGA